MIPPIELASAEEIKVFQEEKLKELLTYLAEKSRFYKKMFSDNAIDISQIKTLEDLQQIPVTTKTDLQQHNYNFLCVPKHEIIDYATTSGTLGKPVVVGLTDNDLDRLAYNEAISLACAGIKKGDVVQLMTTIDRGFVAGLAYFLGLRKIGAGVIRIGPRNPQLQWDSIVEHKPKYLIAVPSFLLKMIAYAEANQIDYNQLGVEGIICIGEALRTADLENNVLANRILEKWDVNLYSTYASTEMSTAFTECTYQNAGHLHPELIIIEVLDNQNNPVKDGEEGELTITTLGVEAMPLLRFKTGDIVTVFSEKCKCGRNTKRVGPVLGRKKQLVKYKGTSIYPPAIFDILNFFDSIKLYLVELHTNDIGNDEICVKIASDDVSEEFLNKVKSYLQSKLRVIPTIEFCELETLAKLVFNPNKRKPTYLIDYRI
ncbi:MAG: phenylacetate--CoA ligase family protein [Mesonia hippocampi]|uniref:phenylacetate--CoA ligase family protein n=1 Tax=Mesonia hippocampi TaxID=1628250 RepID=UPI003F957D6E